MELLGEYDTSRDESLSAFLEKHEGAISVGLNTGSAEKAAAFLKSRGVDFSTGDGTIKFEGSPDPPPVFWHWVEIREGSFLSDSIFLIEYTQARTDYRKTHPENYVYKPHQNASRNISSVWMAARDVEETSRRLERIGLPRKRKVDFPEIGGRGVEFEAGRGSIVVLSPKETKGKILRFIAQRGEGVIGASVEVADLASCRQILEKSGLWPAAYEGNLRG